MATRHGLGWVLAVWLVSPTSVGAEPASIAAAQQRQVAATAPLGARAQALADGLQASCNTVLVALFNAAPGPYWLGEFTRVLQGVESKTALARILADSSVFQSLYPLSLSPDAFATRWLESLAPGLDASELAHGYIAGQLAAGVPRADLMVMAIDALAAYEGSDKLLTAARASFAAKLARALAYSRNAANTAIDLPTLQAAARDPLALDYELTLGAPALAVNVQSLDAASGLVTVNGVAMSPLEGPFTWDWGDGTSTIGWFPQSHLYADRTRRYRLSLAARTPQGGSRNVATSVVFPSSWATLRVDAPVAAPATLRVTLPTVLPTLASTMPGYGFAPTLAPIDTSRLSGGTPSLLADVLAQAARVTDLILQGDYVRPRGSFAQVVLRDATAQGAYSIWFSDPPAVAAGDGMFNGRLPYSSLIHEMAHNFTLNAPAAYRTGGKLDGPANAIYSELVAQLFQHVVALELVNRRIAYGLPDDVAMDLADDARATAAVVRSSYEAYVAAGLPFTIWNDGSAAAATRSVQTFMVPVYKFLQLAGERNNHVAALGAFMSFLRRFDADWHARFAPSTASASADRFRATWIVAALSTAFGQDLRADLRALAFPVDDAIYAELMARR